MVIVDSDVLIDFLDGDQSIREPLLKRMQSENLATTIINNYELLKGAESIAQEELVMALLTKIDIYPLDYASVKSAAKIFQNLKKTGRPIPESDILVAGIAHARGEIILTRDKHFKHIPMIKVEII
jgi:predicted nucleic acid-binding protein